MKKSLGLRRLLILFTLLALLLMPLTVMAQEGDDHGEDTAAETTDEHGDEAAAEGEEATSPLEPLGINAGYMAAQIINFLIIFGALTALLWRPAVNMLDQRSAKIAKGLEDAAAAAKARQNAEAEAEKIMAEARTKVAKEIEDARGRADEVAKNIEAQARSEAERIRQEAENEAAAARDTELAGLRDQVVSISVAMAERLVGEGMDDKKQKSIINDFFSKTPEGAKSLTGKVQVVSAMPLTDAEKKKAEKEIGGDELEFVVEPAILGGLILRSGDRVIDGSVRGQLRGLSESLG